MRNPETARRLEEAMNDMKLSAKELSVKSGVSESSISQYLHGLFAPRSDTAAKLAKVLNVNPMWLMNFENELKHRITEHLDYYVSGSGDMIETISEYDEKGRLIQRLFQYLKLLNEQGIEKLMERAQELTELPKYQKDPEQ